jgi:hypothetical protein
LLEGDQEIVQAVETGELAMLGSEAIVENAAAMTA